MNEYNTEHNMEDDQSVDSLNISNEDTDTLTPDNLGSDSTNIYDHDTNTANVNDQCIPMKTMCSDHLTAYHCVQINQ